MSRFEAGQLVMQARAQRAAGEAAHRHEGHDGYSSATSAAAVAQVRACVDAIGALDVVAGPGEVQQPDPRAVTFADEAIAATNSGPMTDAEVQADMVREVTIPPAQPQQPGGEEAQPCPFCGVLPLIHPPDNDCSWDFVLCWSDDCQAHPAVRGDDARDAIRKWNRRVHAPDVRAQALEEAAQVCEDERRSWVADETPIGAHAAACCRKAIRALIAGAAP